MNALVIIDTDALTPKTVFAAGGVEGIISKIETEVRAIDRDISTPEGRETIKSLAYKVARSKTALDEMGKELVAGIKAQAGKIDADRRIVRDRLDALKDEVRGPLTAWEDAEAFRISDHEKALVFIIESPRIEGPQLPSASSIGHRIGKVNWLSANRDWQEFHERAQAAAVVALAALEITMANAIQAERDAAELAELRRQKAEREEADRQVIERQRLITAEQERARQIEREKEAAAARAVEQERQRAAAAEAAEKAAAAKREANKKHRAKVHAAIIEALIKAGPVVVDAEFTAAALVEAIAAGKIPHVSITY